jgi:hypothetical protein
MVKLDPYLNSTVCKAEDAFWQVIASAYPEAKSGDLDPLVEHHLVETMVAAAKRWVQLNVPGGKTE